jgi:hypothetical protein
MIRKVVQYIIPYAALEQTNDDWVKAVTGANVPER